MNKKFSKFSKIVAAIVLAVAATTTFAAGAGAKILPLGKMQQSQQWPYFTPGDGYSEQEIFDDQKEYLNHWEKYLGADTKNPDYKSPYEANGGDKLKVMYQKLLNGDYDPVQTKPEKEAPIDINAPENTPSYSRFNDYSEYPTYKASDEATEDNATLKKIKQQRATQENIKSPIKNW